MRTEFTTKGKIIMLVTFLKKLGVAVALGGACVAQAATISLQPAIAGSVLQGDQFQLEVYMDFTDDPTIGGGFDILYDTSRVSYISGSFLIDPLLFSDPAFTRDDDLLSPTTNRVDVDPIQGKIVGAAFGDFIGLTGPSLVGTLTFLAESSGSANFLLTATENPLAGNFISAFTNDSQVVSFVGTSQQISAVPVPAAAWLMLSGLASFAGIARRKAA